jgi:hypothetical protein
MQRIGLFQHADEMRRRSMILKVKKESMLKAAKRRRAGTVEHCDYLTNKNYRCRCDETPFWLKSFRTIFFHLYVKD